MPSLCHLLFGLRMDDQTIHIALGLCLGRVLRATPTISSFAGRMLIILASMALVAKRVRATTLIMLHSMSF